jgi:hypothetical protein
LRFLLGHVQLRLHIVEHPAQELCAEEVSNTSKRMNMKDDEQIHEAKVAD